MVTEYAQRDNAGLYPAFHALLDYRCEEGKVYSDGEGGRSVEGGYSNLEE